MRFLPSVKYTSSVPLDMSISMDPIMPIGPSKRVSLTCSRTLIPASGLCSRILFDPHILRPFLGRLAPVKKELFSCCLFLSETCNACCFAGTMSREYGQSSNSYRRSYDPQRRNEGRDHRRRKGRDNESPDSQNSTSDEYSVRRPHRSLEKGKAPEENLAPRSNVYTTPKDYQPRLSNIKRRIDGQQVMRFGQAQLPVLEPNDPTAFRPLQDLPIDPPNKEPS
ncbi:hypothetical protein VNO77_07581 [Canavalia gladiata]|uniref:Uncharacterized protein n=1 Tax=Canavalia gladiata TaxID=3824 RepID=A0AAN9QTG2_CANGL